MKLDLTDNESVKITFAAISPNETFEHGGLYFVRLHARGEALNLSTSLIGRFLPGEPVRRISLKIVLDQ